MHFSNRGLKPTAKEMSYLRYSAMLLLSPVRDDQLVTMGENMG